MSEIKSKRLRVCVVGAGAAGLCVARHLSEVSQFDFEVYEKTSKVGGIWNYTDSVGLDDNGLPVHTSLYKNMKTNLPMKIMEFQDFESKCEETFVTHNEVLKYLENYAKHFHLFKYIKFYRQIITIKRIENFWKVLVKDIKTNEINEQMYDSVIVCNGRYSVPNVPTNLKGIENFKSKIIHSHDYREPQPFTAQNVLVLGAGPSGIDISIEVSETANHVVLCHRNVNPLLNLPQNITQEMSEITEISEKRIQFKSGNQWPIDSIILCTGYHFEFPFLDKSCAINVNKWGRVEGVYLHLVNMSYPSMAIFSIPIKVVPFPLYHIQALFVVKCLTREVILPAKEQMKKQTEEDFSIRESMGWTQKYSHKMIPKMYFDYCDKLSQMMALKERLSPVFRQLYIDLEEIRRKDLTGYKNCKIQIISNEKYVIHNKSNQN